MSNGWHPLATTTDRSNHIRDSFQVLIQNLIQRHRVLLAEITIGRERQIADPRAGGGENRITKRGNEGRHSWLSDTSRWRRALRDVDVRLSRNLVDPSHGVIIEIGLLDYAVLGSDLPAAHDARAENHGAFELRPGRFRIDYNPCI